LRENEARRGKRKETKASLQQQQQGRRSSWPAGAERRPSWAAEKKSSPRGRLREATGKESTYNFSPEKEGPDPGGELPIFHPEKRRREGVRNLERGGKGGRKKKTILVESQEPPKDLKG